MAMAENTGVANGVRIERGIESARGKRRENQRRKKHRVESARPFHVCDFIPATIYR
jgi:hypothetical protein